MADANKNQSSDIAPDIRPDLPGGSSRNATSAQDLGKQEKDAANTANDSSVDEAERAGGGSAIVNKFTGGGNKKTFNKRAFLKSKGPIAGILITLVAGGGALVGVSGPILALVHFKQSLSEALNVTDPALRRTNIKLMSLKIDSLKNGFAESSDGKCNVRCKFGTISDSMKRNLESPKNGFKATFSSTKVNGRWLIESLTFPSGDTVTNGKDMTTLMKKTENAAAFSKIVNSKTEYFLNSRFGSFLSRSFGLDKLAKLSGNTKDKVAASMRKALGLPENKGPTTTMTRDEKIAAARNGRFAKAFAVMDSAPGKAVAKGVNVVGVACTAYDSGRGVSIAIKIAKAAAFITLGFAIANVADQIVAGDNPDPAVVSYAGDLATRVDTNKTLSDGSVNKYYNKSLMDSAAYREAVDGDNPGTLSNEELKYTTMPAGDFAKSIASLTAGLLGTGVGGLAIAHGMCKASTNVAAGVAMSCGEEIIAAAATAVETLGVGAVLSAAVCAAKVIAIGVGTGIALGVFINSATDNIVDSELPDVDETNTYGARLGDVSVNAQKDIYNGSGTDLGMHVGDSDGIVQYSLDTADLREQDKAIARYDASKTPYDITNQYSFLGTFMQNLGITSFMNSSFSGTASNIAAILPNSLGSLSSLVKADDVSADAAKKGAIYSKNVDPSLEALGIPTDSYGMTSNVMDSAQLNMGIDDNLDYMIDNHYINEDTGEAIDGSDYAKWVTYCSERVEPMGETSASITEDDYDWMVGLRCVNNSKLDAATKTKLDNFGVYRMNSNANALADGDGNDETTATTTGGFTLPLNKGYSISQGFTSSHKGLDMAQAQGSPVYSVSGGTVITAPSPDSVCSASDNLLEIQLTTGEIVGYMHMDASDITVTKGDKVTEGQQVGKVNECGEATGSHLHMEVRAGSNKEGWIDKLDKESQDGVEYVDPIGFMKYYGVNLKP